MLKKIIFPFLLTLSFPMTAHELPTLPKGIKLVETIAKKDDNTLVIPYKKYQLDNGLTVILHKDDSNPLVHVDVTYHVGSGREVPEKSGFAHFFEHMMFQGSKHVGDEQHFKIVTESGGNLNGTTNRDRTNYFETVPKNQLEKMLWLESDRMGFMIDGITEKKFINQRDTVYNEREQNYDNRPYGLLHERLSEAVFPKGHPYHWPTIGYREHIKEYNINDLKAFFLRWYGPNNATLTIGGDIDEAQTLKWVAKYFGGIPRGPEVAEPQYVEVTLDKPRYLSLEDNVSLPLVDIAFPTVHLNHADEAPLDVLASIIGQGKTSLLYKNLEKNGLAVQAGVSHYCSELACNFELYALPNPAKGKSLADLEKIIYDTFAEFEKRGVQDDDLTRVKAGIKADLIYDLESVRGKVGYLASNQTFEGDPNRIQKDIDRYNAVTKADVMRVYEKYIKGKPAATISIVPKGQKDAVAKTDNWTRPAVPTPTEFAKADELKLREVKDGVDRSKQPPAGDNPTLKVPTIWRASLDNDIEILGAKNDETPTTAISLRFKSGLTRTPLDKVGVASLTADLLNEATTENSAETLSNELQKLGSEVSFSSGANFTTMRVKTLTENVDKTLAIAVEKLTKPKFDQADFDRVKAQTIEGIKDSHKKASKVANSAFMRVVYGDNAQAFPTSGVLETVEKLTLDDVKAFYQQTLNANLGSLVIVTSLDEKSALEVLEKSGLNAIGKADVKPIKVNDITSPKTAIYLIDIPDAAQSEIRIGKRALTYDATGEYYRAGLMNYNLGDAFNSRINLNLREDKGYTYGAYSFFGGNDVLGRFMSGAGVKRSTTADAVREILKEIKTYRDKGVTDAEVTFLKQSLGQSDALKYETPSQKLGFLAEILLFDLADNYTDEQAKILTAIDKAELNELAKKHLNIDEMVIVIAGDKAKLKDDLDTLAKELNRDIIELDVNGAVKAE